MVDIWSACYMLGTPDLLETAPETHNQYLMDECRDNFKTTLELRNKIGYSEFKALSGKVAEVKQRRRAILELTDITDPKLMNREIVRLKLSDSKNASRYA